MLACGPLSRFDHLRRAARLAGALSNPLLHSQDCFFHYNLNWVSSMGKSKDGSKSVNRQDKRKAVTSVWRPISTKSGSHEVYVAKELKTNLRDSYEAVGCSERSDDGCEVHVAHDNQDEPIPSVTVASPSNANDQIYYNHCEALKDQSVSLSRDMVNLPESFDCRVISESEKAVHERQVKGGILLDSVTETYSELANQVSKESKHSVRFEVDASLIRFVKGKWGSTQKQIEETTGVKIVFPSSKEENYLILEGTSSECVAKATQVIGSLLEEVVKSPKLDYSHFISLPLAIYPELVEKLNNFQNTILGISTSSYDDNSDSGPCEHNSDDGDDEDKPSENPMVAVKHKVQEEKEHATLNIGSKSKAATLSDLGIDKSIFIKPKTFHLTVLMLKLWNKDRIAAATEILQKVSSKVNDALDNRPVSIKLKGLECMRGSPAKARVLYAPVKEIGGEGRLLRACQVIIEAYVEAGLVQEKDARQALKLHATLMNARHRKWKKGTKRHESFDARWILKRYGSEEWGDFVIREAHLSQRFSFDQRGYYHCCATIPFPEKNGS